MRLPLPAAAIIAILLAASPALSAEGPEALFGLVIGSNVTSDGSEVPLKYADDDAVLNAALLRQLGARVILLTTLDGQTRAVHPDVETTAPTREAVEVSARVLSRAMAEARSAGASPILYLFFSGHGDVEHNEGFVHLEDGRFWRRDLIRLLEDSGADRNHLVIDACKSYFMAFSRGAGGSRKPVGEALDLDDERIPDNTGVLLSTSSATESHEWEAFQSGIFSHEVRSALRGAADLNLDSAISYTEAAAFVWNANAKIANRRFRPHVYARPPATGEAGDAVLARTDGARGDRLSMGPGVSEHAYLEDENGLRLADLHPAGGQRLVVLIPSSRPIFLRRPGSGTEVELPPGRQLDLSSLEPRPASSLARGAGHVAFEKLFEAPFGPDSVARYEERPPDEFTPPGPRDGDIPWLRRGIGVMSILALAAGGTMTGLAATERNKIDGDSTGLERSEANDRIRAYNTAAVTSYAVGGAAALTYILWTLIPRWGDDVDVELAGTAGLRLEVEF